MITVLANGCFDIFHYGHLLHLLAARRLGDQLVVSITNDAFVNKGPGRPTFPAHERAAVVAGQSCVTRVICVDNLLEALEFIRPQVLVKGKDYVGNIESIHEMYCRRNGIQIILTDEPIYSVTRIIHDRLKQG